MRNTLSNGASNKNLTMACGANLLGLTALVAYTIKNMNEMKKNMNEIREEIINIKGSTNENNKKMNIVINRINQKLEENTQRIENQQNVFKKEINAVPNMNEIDSAVLNLMNNPP